MTSPSGKSSDSRWTGILRGKKRRPLEWLVEKGIFLVSLSAILMVFLIFLFVGREALPIFLGKMDSSVEIDVVQPDQMASLSKAELQTYLELSDDEFLTALGETANIVISYGTSYSSGLFMFGGGDSAEIQQRELIEELKKRKI